MPPDNPLYVYTFYFCLCCLLSLYLGLSSGQTPRTRTTPPVLSPSSPPRSSITGSGQLAYRTGWVPPSAAKSPRSPTSIGHVFSSRYSGVSSEKSTCPLQQRQSLKISCDEGTVARVNIDINHDDRSSVDYRHA